jgi:hypothetical protein
MERFAATFRITSCPKCGYELRGLPTAGACPECGQAYHERMLFIPVRRSGERSGFATLLVVALLLICMAPVVLGLMAVLMILAAGTWLIRRVAGQRRRLHGLYVDPEGFAVSPSPQIASTCKWSEVRRIRMLRTLSLHQDYLIQFEWAFLASRIGARPTVTIRGRMNARRTVALLRRYHQRALQHAPMQP